MEAFFSGVSSPINLLIYEKDMLASFRRSPQLKELLLSTVESIDVLFTAGRYYATAQVNSNLTALLNEIDLVISDQPTIVYVSSSSSADLAVQVFRESADGGPKGTSYWKNSPVPLTTSYADFYLFFVQRLNTIVKPTVLPGVFYTDLPDGTRITVYPLSTSNLSPTVEISKRPSKFKMRYLSPGKTL